MLTAFRPLGAWDDLPRILRKDGWVLACERGDCILAEYPDVADEEVVRERLQRLGLLTSSCLHIEFLSGQRAAAPSRAAANELPPRSGGGE